MVKKEVEGIIKKHISKLGDIAKKMKLENNTACGILIDSEEILELRAICILAYEKLTGVDLQEEPFEKGGD